MSGNPFTRPLRETMNDPMFNWARPRFVRRLLVAVFVALLIAMPVLLWATQAALILIAMLVPFVFLMGSLNASVRGLTELRARDLDERENAMRGGVYAMLYWPGVFLAVAGGLAMRSLDVGSGFIVTGGGLALFFLAMGLPVLWLAWSLPDEPTAD